MSQRTIRFKDDVEAEIEARAKAEGRSFAGWVKRAVEKALVSNVDRGRDATTDDDLATGRPSPAPPRPPKKTTGRRTPPRPVKKDPIVAAVSQHLIAGDGYMKVSHEAEEPEESTGCAECGGDIAVHPEFGRYCTGCGARVR